MIFKLFTPDKMLFQGDSNSLEHVSVVLHFTLKKLNFFVSNVTIYPSQKMIISAKPEKLST